MIVSRGQQRGLRETYPCIHSFPDSPFIQCHITLSRLPLLYTGTLLFEISSKLISATPVSSSHESSVAFPTNSLARPVPPFQIEAFTTCTANPLHPILSFSKSTYHLYLHGRIYLFHSFFTLCPFDWKA